MTELGCKIVHAITSAERDKTHTILACVSALECALPKSVPDKLKKVQFLVLYFVTVTMDELTKKFICIGLNYF